MLITLCLVQPKYTKMYKQETPSRGPDALEVFCAPLNMDFLSDLYEKFQVLSTLDANVKY